ncbi:hypothetical protein HG530_015718 [Fusarium avenaceum]|nr:hypothetical protein HG530_015718 [Fusarium avenaceum]
MSGQTASQLIQLPVCESAVPRVHGFPIAMLRDRLGEHLIIGVGDSIVHLGERTGLVAHRVGRGPLDLTCDICRDKTTIAAPVNQTHQHADKRTYCVVNAVYGSVSARRKVPEDALALPGINKEPMRWFLVYKQTFFNGRGEAIEKLNCSFNVLGIKDLNNWLVLLQNDLLK